MEKLSKEIKAALSRCSDQNYYVSKLLSGIYLEKNPNPKFTIEDQKKMLEIFEIPNTKTCFLTGKPCKGVGDHIYAINEYYRRSGRRGINDPWNIIPVCGERNKNYKLIKFKLNGVQVKKDIGYEDLTGEEACYLLSSDDNMELEMGVIYYKVYMWKKYVKSRGAVISYEEDESYEKVREKFKMLYNESLWDPILKEMEKIILS